MTVQIRRETLHDHASIRDIITAAFEQSDHGYHGEAGLVEQIRRQQDDLVALIAAVDAHIVGHVLFSAAKIEQATGSISGAGLAPVAVQPDHQRQGIGGMLIRAGLSRLAEKGTAFVVVIGNPAYYSRFGFLPAADFKLRHTFAGIPQKYMMIRCLQSDVTSAIGDGTVHYCPAFQA